MAFFGCLSQGSMEFPRQERGFKEIRGFPGMGLGIFRVAKSSGEGRPCGAMDTYIHTLLPTPAKKKQLRSFHLNLFKTQLGLWGYQGYGASATLDYHVSNHVDPRTTRLLMAIVMYTYICGGEGTEGD